MRLHLKLSPSNKRVPYEHQHLLTGTIHKWIGPNTIHDELSLYSFSQMKGGSTNRQGLFFTKGASWFISAWDNTIIKQLIKGIQADPEMFYGMKVIEIVLQETPDLSDKTHFLVASPIFIQRTINDNKKFFLYTDKEASQLLTETLIHKMAKAGLPADDTLEIAFDTTYRQAKTKMIRYKEVNNRCNWCPVIIKGTPETKAFAWEVGVGNSTGIGFGAIM
ncbi:CRISPR-associated endoribonuclease Cas6 [Marinilabiliaceae bacterium JC017]|nr:CRISPR-associated endoribonuclease Cas6 [Marinilabiliaceae bacterium JC017]